MITAVLSDRQQQILALIARGKSNKEIATTLHISTFTVHNHVASILQRLGAVDRANAVALGYGVISERRESDV